MPRVVPWSLLLCVLLSCANDLGGSAAVLSVTIAPLAGAPLAGSAHPLSVTVETTGGASRAVAWSTSDGTVAAVGPDGVLRAIAPGSVEVRATSVFDAARSAGLSVTVVDDADNRLVIGSLVEPLVVGDLLRLAENSVYAIERDRWLFANLYDVDLEGRPQPGLVTEVATLQNGRMTVTDVGDGTRRVELRLTLRDGASWSDGTPITTSDLAFVNEVVTTSDAPLPNASYWQRFGYQTVDDRTFVVVIDAATGVDLLASPMPVLPAHVLAQAWADARALGLVGSDAAEAYRNVFRTAGSPAAIRDGSMAFSGAFSASSWETGANLVMTRNPWFYGHPANADPWLRRVVYRSFDDVNALLAALRAGELGTVAAATLSNDQLLGLASSDLAVHGIPSTQWEHLDVNQFVNVPEVADLLLHDVRTRRAILHAIDRQGLIDAVWQGMGIVAHTNVHPLDPIHDPDVPTYDYDPAVARSLLADLGWTAGTDGVLERDAGGRRVRFELEFVTTAGNASREQTQALIAQQLLDVGVAVRFANQPSNVVFATGFFNRGYDGVWTGLFLFAWHASRASMLNATTYLCRNAPVPANGYAGTNLGGACSPPYDSLRDEAVAQLDPAAALPLYREMQAEFAEGLLGIPLFFGANATATASGLVNHVASTFVNGTGHAPPRPELVGWAHRGVPVVFEQRNHGVPSR